MNRCKGNPVQTAMYEACLIDQNLVVFSEDSSNHACSINRVTTSRWKGCCFDHYADMCIYTVWPGWWCDFTLVSLSRNDMLVWSRQSPCQYLPEEAFYFGLIWDRRSQNQSNVRPTHVWRGGILCAVRIVDITSAFFSLGSCCGHLAVSLDTNISPNTCRR